MATRATFVPRTSYRVRERPSRSPFSGMSSTINGASPNASARMPHERPERRRKMVDTESPQHRYNHSLKGKIRSLRHERTPKRAVGHRKASAIWNMTHPDQRKAHHLVERLVRLGELIPLPCELCGDVRSEAHHPFGYQGLMARAVWWLCRWHHGHMHRQMKVAQ